MEKRIYISNWSKGEYLQPNQIELIDLFVRGCKKYNPDLIIKFIVDTKTYESITDYTRDNTMIINILDKHINRPEIEWASVKLQTIKELDDDHILHVDYDIIYADDFGRMLDVFINSEYDVIYQKREFINNHGHYVQTIFQDEYRKLIGESKLKTAFNSGIIYIRSKDILEHLIVEYGHEDFASYISLEQIKNPLTLSLKGYKIGVLNEMLKEFKPFRKPVMFKDCNIDCKKLSTLSFFMPNIGFYHFVSSTKHEENSLDIMRDLWGIENIDEVDNG